MKSEKERASGEGRNRVIAAEAVASPMMLDGGGHRRFLDTGINLTLPAS